MRKGRLKKVMYSEIKNIFGDECLLDFSLSSRVSKIIFEGKQIGIKRDDELSCGVSGSKYRKFSSIIPYIKSREFSHIVTEGSEFSNNIAGMCQLFNEYQIKYTLILKKGYSDQAVNKKLIKLLADENSKITLERKDWKNRREKIDEICHRLETSGEKIVFLPEGSFHESALPGSMTLAFDIDTKIYKEIFIDAGTGMSFVGLYYGLSLKNFTGKLYVISLFENKEYFEKKIASFKQLFPNVLIKIPYDVITLSESKSFGGLTNSLKENIKMLSREYGILTDPLYSGKSIPVALNKIKQENFGNALVIHSGGAQTLSGFID